MEKILGFTFSFLKKNGYTIKKGEKSIYQGISYIKNKETGKTYPKKYSLFALEQTAQVEKWEKEKIEEEFLHLQKIFITSKILDI